MTAAIVFTVLWSGSQVGLVYALFFRRSMRENRRELGDCR